MKEQLIQAYFEATTIEEKKTIAGQLDELDFFWDLIEAIDNSYHTNKV